MPARLSLLASLVLFVSLLAACDSASTPEDSLIPQQAAQTDRTRAGSVGVQLRINHNPVIVAMNAEPIGSSARLVVQVSDPDGDALTFAWSASCAGSFDDIYATEPVFTYSLPFPATCTFNVDVRDEVGGERAGELTVSPAPVVVEVSPGPAR